SFQILITLFPIKINYNSAIFFNFQRASSMFTRLPGRIFQDGLFKQIKIDEKMGTPGSPYILYLILAGFSDIIINKLLNSLQDTSDSKERISIIHVIEEIGQRAIPTIKERITANAPWYFLRNLATY
ncbi:MAG: hypothetical protein WBN66_11215, partial [Smithella sp.]